jgi:hypothetical protein
VKHKVICEHDKVRRLDYIPPSCISRLLADACEIDKQEISGHGVVLSIRTLKAFLLQMEGDKRYARH